MHERAHPLNLLDLPLEVLSLVLEYLLIISPPSCQPPVACFTNDSRSQIPLCPCSVSPVDPISVFLIHPSVHAVACPLFYTSNLFVLDMTERHARHVRHTLTDPFCEPEQRPLRGLGLADYTRGPLLLQSPNALRRIRRLRVRLDRLRGWVSEEVQPILEDMILNGELTDLVVDIVTPVTTARKAAPDGQRHYGPDLDEKDGGILRRQPVAGMLKVLADPYLRTAKLFISIKHQLAWCRWHEGDCAEMIKSREPETVPRVLEVDWKGIRHEYDPEGLESAKEITTSRW